MPFKQIISRTSPLLKQIAPKLQQTSKALKRALFSANITSYVK